MLHLSQNLCLWNNFSITIHTFVATWEYPKLKIKKIFYHNLMIYAIIIDKPSFLYKFITFFTIHVVRIMKYKNCVYKFCLWRDLIQFLYNKKKLFKSRRERFQNAFGFNNHIADIIRFLEISLTLVIRLVTHKEDSQDSRIRNKG